MPKLSCQCGTVIELSWAVLRARAGYELACPVCGKVRRLPRLTPESEATADTADAAKSFESEPRDAESPRRIEFESWVEPPSEPEPAPATVEFTSLKLGTVKGRRFLRNFAPTCRLETLDPDQTEPNEFASEDPESVELAALIAASAAAYDPQPDNLQQSRLRPWQARMAGAWRAWKSKEKTLSSWGISAAVHTIVAVILALWMLPHAAPGEGGVWVESLIGAADESALDMVEAATTAAIESQPANATSSLPTHPASSQALLPGSTASEAHANLAPAAAQSAPASKARLPQLLADELPGGALLEPVALQVPRRSVADGGVSSAGAQNARGALDEILAGLRDKQGEGGLKVVWLIDASISLHQDRQMIADRLDAFYKEQAKTAKKDEYKFLSVAVSFGSVPRELVASTRLGQRVPAAIRNLQVDSSGLENVMSAVEYCVQRYRRPLKGLMQIVIWTDESGDDIQRLEETIQLCRKTRTMVSIVGPSAVLGSETGSHQYTDPGTGFAFLIPVKRGPDTSLPERVALPYWWGAPLPPRLIDGAVPAIDAPRHGGPYRDRLMSGFGPYALTRLALETGGTFTILSRPGDPPEFPFDTMKAYAPDYSSAADYLQTTQAGPLRRTVSDAVLRTVQAGYPPPPQTGFGVKRDLFYPFLPFTDYTSPQAFRASLGTQLREQRAQITAMLAVIHSALSYFPAEGLDRAYSEEQNPRWKAWYDLTRGRLLAQSLRYREYLAASERLLEGDVLKPETNLLYLQPSSSLLTGSAGAAMASESARYLERCVRNNPGTPWELLAKWELESGLGITWQEQVIPPPRPVAGPVAPVSSPPTISLPRL